MTIRGEKPWSRAIILVDMNAFFASVEQLDHPELRGQPVVVTNGKQGTCVITSSYEARAYGIKTGMRMRQARELCPSVIQCPANPKRYAQLSGVIMQALHEITPDIEVFSVDEAFLDVTACQQLHGSPDVIASLVKQLIFDVSGLACSVGVSGDKTTAKYAAKLVKPDGLTIIPPWEAKQRLHAVPVTDLCGIAHGIGNFLARYGVFYCGDMEHLPISILSKRFGNPGRRIWYMCQGADPEPVITRVPPPKSIGHGKVIPPNTRDRNTILTYLLHMSEKVAARLRRHDMVAMRYFIGLRHYQHGWIGGKYRTDIGTNDGRVIFQLCQQMLQQCWRNEGVSQVQITALDPQADSLQQDMFTVADPKRHEVNCVTDIINNRYGELTLAPARLLGRSSMPNVISPAWKPDGHRQTI